MSGSEWEGVGVSGPRVSHRRLPFSPPVLKTSAHNNTNEQSSVVDISWRFLQNITSILPMYSRNTINRTPLFNIKLKD